MAATMFSIPEIGEVIEFLYPAQNKFGVPLEYRRRIVEIREIHDFREFANPLTLEDFLRRPLIRRGKLLLIGQDLELGQQRRFYLEAMRRPDEMPPAMPLLRLGLTDPEEPADSPEFFGPAFYPDTFNRRVMLHAVREWLRIRKPRHSFQAAVFPVEAA